MVKYSYNVEGNKTAKAFYASATAIANLNPFRYRSYYYDTETNLYFLKTRYYDPEIARFMTIDAVRYLNSKAINGLNLYAYCHNNPIIYIDSDGTDAILITMYALGGGGLPIVGHSAVFVQDSDNNWYFTEFTGSLGFELENLLKFKNPFVVEAYIKTYQMYINPEDYLAKYYAEYETLYLQGDYSQSAELANEYKGSDYGGYNLFTNNCAHYVEEILSVGQNNYGIVNSLHDNKITIPVVLHYGTIIMNEIGKLTSKISSWWNDFVFQFCFQGD